MIRTGIVPTLPLWFVAVVGCDNREECEVLAKMEGEMRTLTSRVKARVALAERIGRSLDKQQSRAEAALDRLQLDLPEEALTEAFQERVADLPGVVVERTTVSGEGRGLDTETAWRFQISERPWKGLFRVLDELVESPPLTQLYRLEKTDAGHELVLKRAVVGQVTREPPKPPRPELPDPSQVERSWFGTCGAGALRRNIAELKAEFAAHIEDAEQAAQAMTETATWRSLYDRTRLLAERELRARQVISGLLEAVREKQLEFVAIGTDDGSVVLDLKDGPRVKARLEEGLDDELLAQLREVDTLPGNGRGAVRRFSVPHPMERSVRGQSGEHEGHVGGFSGLPSPEEVREQILRMEKKSPPPDPGGRGSRGQSREDSTE